MEGFGRSLAVIIGVNAYGNGIPSLKSAVNDARALAAALGAQNRFDTYDEVLLKLDQEATLPELRKLLGDRLKNELKEDDRLLFYFAGHGTTHESKEGPVGYLLLHDADAGDPDSFWPMVEVHRALSELKCRHMLVILDCCFAGAFRWAGTRHFNSLPAQVYQQRYAGYIRFDAKQVLTSATQTQTALDLAVGVRHFQLGERLETEDHSPFAQALLEGLAGAADIVPKGAGDGLITANELFTYLRERFTPANGAGNASQTPSFWTLDRNSWGEYLFFAPGSNGPATLDDAPPLDPDQNPYRGLQPYCEAQRALFFGRSTLVDKLAGQIIGQEVASESAGATSGQALTVILGPSGAGKTSLIQAGLLPRLCERFGEGCEILTPIRPGAAPLAALEGLTRPNGEKLWELQSGPTLTPGHALAAVVGEWSAANPGKQLYLIVDQLEELWLPACRAEERDEFLALVQSAVMAHPATLRVVAGLRADSAARFEASLLRPDLHASICEVDSVRTQDDLRRMIEGPAVAKILYFEPGEFVETLVNDVVNEPGGMPLLSLAMSQMFLKLYAHWQAHPTSDRALTPQLYDEFGGVTGLLRTSAESIYDELAPEGRETMRRILLRMVEPSDDGWAAQRIDREELCFGSEAENQRVAAVLDRLTAARLVVQDGGVGKGSTVEPAHSCLVKQWEALIEWIELEQNRPGGGNLTFQHQVAQAVGAWNGAGRDDSHLWADRKRVRTLAEALTLQPAWLNQAEGEFAQRSLARARRQVWRARGVAALVAVLLLAILAGWQFYQYRQALTASKELTDQAIDALTQAMQPAKALNLALAALPSPGWRRPYSPTAEFILRQALQDTLARANGRVSGGIRGPGQIAFRDDVGRGAGSDDDLFGGAAIAAGGDGVVVVNAALDAAVRLGAAGRDGVRVAWSEDGLLLDYDYLFGREVHVWPDARTVISQTFDAPILCAHWQPKNRRVAVCSGDTIWLWSPLEGSAPELFYNFPVATTVADVVWSPDGRRMIAWNDHYDVLIWNPDADYMLQLTPGAHKGFIYEAVWSAAGRQVVTVSNDHSAKLWSMATPDAPVVLIHQTGVIGAAFVRIAQSKDDYIDRFVTWDADSRIHLWDLQGSLVRFVPLNEDAPFYELEGGPGGIKGVFQRAGERRLLTYTSAGTAKIWNLQTGALVQELENFSPGVALVDAAWQGDYIVMVDAEGMAGLWNAQTGDQLALFRAHGKSETGVGVRWRDRSHVLTYGNDDSAGSDDSGGSGGMLRLWQVLDAKGAPLCQGVWQAQATAGASAAGLNGVETLPRCFNQAQGLTQVGIQSAHWLDNETVLLTGPAGTARRWSTASNSIALVAEPLEPLDQAVWDPKGERFFAYQAQVRGAPIVDGQVRTAGDATANVPVTGPISSAFWLAEGLFVSSEEGRLRRVDPGTGELLAEYPGTAARTAALAVSGQRMAAGGVDGALHLWELPTGKPLAIDLTLGDAGTVTTLQWDAAGWRLLAAGKGAVVLREIPDKGKGWRYPAEGVAEGSADGATYYALLSPDDRYVAVYGGRGIVVLDAADGRPVWWLASPQSDNVTAGVQWVLGATWPGQRYDAQAVDLYRQWRAGRPWRIDDRRLLLLSWGGDGPARLWDPESRQELWRGYDTKPITLAAVSPDGATVFTVGRSWTVRRWPLWLNQPEQLLGAARAAAPRELVVGEAVGNEELRILGR